MTFTWTDEAIYLAKKMKDNGCSGATIARELSRKYNTNVNRNAVLGKLFRIARDGVWDLEQKPPEWVEPEAPKPEVKVKRAPMPVLFPEEEEEEKVWGADGFSNPAAIGVLFENLKPNHCRFPVGEIRKGTLRFCGAPRASENTSYCEFCDRICKVPLKPGARSYKTKAFHHYRNPS